MGHRLRHLGLSQGTLTLWFQGQGAEEALGCFLDEGVQVRGNVWSGTGLRAEMCGLLTFRPVLAHAPIGQNQLTFLPLPNSSVMYYVVPFHGLSLSYDQEL